MITYQKYIASLNMSYHSKDINIEISRLIKAIQFNTYKVHKYTPIKQLFKDETRNPS